MKVFLKVRKYRASIYAEIKVLDIIGIKERAVGIFSKGSFCHDVEICRTLFEEKREIARYNSLNTMQGKL